MKKHLLFAILAIVAVFIAWTPLYFNLNYPITKGFMSGDLFEHTGYVASISEQHWLMGDTTAAGDVSPATLGTVAGETLGAWELVGGTIFCECNTLDSVVFNIYDSVDDTVIAWSDTIIGTAATTKMKATTLTITATGYDDISTSEGIAYEIKPIGTDTVTDVSWRILWKKKHTVYQ